MGVLTLTAHGHNDNVNNNAKDKRMPSGSDKLDTMLGGGIERGIITQVYGASGTGKTNISIQLAVHCIRGGERVVSSSVMKNNPQIVKMMQKSLQKTLSSMNQRIFSSSILQWWM